MALRKDSIATTIALWEDAEIAKASDEIAPFGGGQERELMDGIVDFFEEILVLKQVKNKKKKE